MAMTYLAPLAHICRLNRLKVRQDKTAAYAASGALPEYKKWVDPALIEAHWKAHEQVRLGLCQLDVILSERLCLQ